MPWKAGIGISSLAFTALRLAGENVTHYRKKFQSREHVIYLVFLNSP